MSNSKVSSVHIVLGVRVSESDPVSRSRTARNQQKVLEHSKIVRTNLVSFTGVPMYSHADSQRRKPSNQHGFHSAITSCFRSEGSKINLKEHFQPFPVHESSALLLHSLSVQPNPNHCISQTNKPTWLYTGSQ